MTKSPVDQVGAARLVELRRARDEVRTRLRLDRARLEALEVEIHALGLGAGSEVESTQSATSAIEQLLRGAGEPMQVAELVDGLASLGITKESKAVSALLSQLRHRGRVDRVARGTWYAS
jgi:hypothetical protein